MRKILRYLCNNYISDLDLISKCGITFRDWRRLHKIPRYLKGHLRLFNRLLCYADSASLRAGLSEIFDKECYTFNADNDAPLIIDCGSNIGLSLIFFKRLYPKAKIICFEADPNLFQILMNNISEFHLSEISPINKAVWHSNSKINFRIEGGFSGRAVCKEGFNVISVDAVRLKEYLNQPIDMLKIDIEGAEYVVLKDCRNKLENVKNIFIEYHSSVHEKQVLGELLNFLTDSGYRFHIKEAFSVQRPFIDRQTQDDMDLQLDIFAYRT